MARKKRGRKYQGPMVSTALFLAAFAMSIGLTKPDYLSWQDLAFWSSVNDARSGPPASVVSSSVNQDRPNQPALAQSSKTVALNNVNSAAQVGADQSGSKISTQNPGSAKMMKSPEISEVPEDSQEIVSSEEPGSYSDALGDLQNARINNQQVPDTLGSAAAIGRTTQGTDSGRLVPVGLIRSQALSSTSASSSSGTDSSSSVEANGIGQIAAAGSSSSANAGLPDNGPSDSSASEPGNGEFDFLFSQVQDTQFFANAICNAPRFGDLSEREVIVLTALNCVL